MPSIVQKFLDIINNWSILVLLSVIFVCFDSLFIFGYILYTKDISVFLFLLLILFSFIGVVSFFSWIVLSRIIKNKLKESATDANKKDLLKGIFNGYYSSIGKEYVIDKSRAWPSEIESLEYIFGAQPKVILFVRDVRDILCSWEKMYRRDKKNGKVTPGEDLNPQAFQTMEKRMEFWSTAESPLGSAFNVMRDAFTRGHSDSLYYFEYEKWTHSPQEEFSKLYEWLEVPDFKHDFDNINQVLFEKDEYYGYTELHNIQEGRLIPSEPQWGKYMSKELSDKYESSNIWKK